MASVWSRVTGRGAAGANPLATDLKKITHSGVLALPKELFTSVIEASNQSEEDRRTIMMHLRECLAEPTGKHWRRISGGLALVEALLKDGSTVLLAETAEGRHFDLVQRLSFLEHWDYSDKRIMNIVRSKAETLRKQVVVAMESAELKNTEDAIKGKDTEDTMKDTASTCSPDSSSAATQVSASSSNSMRGFGSDDMFGESPPVDVTETSKRTMVLNNIVTVGHNDDTTSESEGDADAPVRFGKSKKMTARERNERSSRASVNSGSEVESTETAPSKPATSAPAQTVDLLSVCTETAPSAPATSAPVQTVDLLSF